MNQSLEIDSVSVSHYQNKIEYNWLRDTAANGI
jgi:hypothetical protein